MPRFWPICLLACLASSLLAFFGSSSGLFRTLLLASGLFGMSCFWPSGLFDMLCFYFWPSYGFLVFLRSSGLPTAFGTPGLYDPWPLCLLACGFSRSSGLWLLSAFFSRPLSTYLIARCCSLGLLVLGLLVCALRSARQPYSVSFCSQKTTIFLSSRVWINLNSSADAPSSCANFLRFKSEIGPILAEISHF